MTQLANTHLVTDAGDLQIGVSLLREGLHVLRLETDRGVRVVKFVQR